MNVNKLCLNQVLCYGCVSGPGHSTKWAECCWQYKHRQPEWAESTPATSQLRCSPVPAASTATECRGWQTSSECGEPNQSLSQADVTDVEVWRPCRWALSDCSCYQSSHTAALRIKLVCEFLEVVLHVQLLLFLIKILWQFYSDVWTTGSWHNVRIRCRFLMFHTKLLM